MATRHPSDPARTTESAATADDAPAIDVEAAPEPLTPERALEWNRYYDRYVAGGLLLLVFLVSAHKIANSTIWPLLKTGELIAQTGSPVTTDPFSYTTEPGRPWVNIPWTYEVASHFLYRWGRNAFSSDPTIGEQIGAGFLVFFNALARVLTVWLILKLRRPGPGLWWFAVVATIAFGCVLIPRGAQLEWSVGGFARQALIAPESWGILLLALEILLIDRAFAWGEVRSLYVLLLLFLLWANLDESFAFGLLILLAGAVGGWVERRRDPVRRDPSPAVVMGVVAGSALVCLVNPSTFRIYSAAFASYLAIPAIVFGSDPLLPMPENLAYFGRNSFTFLAANSAPYSAVVRLGYYLVLVGLGFASFLLRTRGVGRRPASYGRLAMFAVAALLWGAMSRLSAEFAVVFAYVVGLNGQEWYQDRFGVAGRVSPSWTAWSVGGRALTILAMFLVMAKTLTGYGYTISRNQPTFGFGVESSLFDFESAEYLRTAAITGRVMNLGEDQGDALIWKAYPARKTFIDHRRRLFGTSLRRDLVEFRRSFFRPTDDPHQIEIHEDPAHWRPILDKYGVTAVLYSPSENPFVFDAMRTSKNWIPLRDDGRTVLFGRADAPEADLAFFRANTLDAEQIVYHRKQPVIAPTRMPTAMGFIDRIIRNRSLTPPDPHVEAARRWLASGVSTENGGLPDAAHCLMAIREARTALHYSPDDTDAYRVLDYAYEFLLRNELATFTDPTDSTPSQFLEFRARQRITVLNYAIQTTPPPRNLDERRDLAALHVRLALVHRNTGDRDLERDNLAAALDLAGPDFLPPGETRRLADLDDLIRRFRDDLQAFTTGQNADALQRASRAASSGFPGIALEELKEAEDQGVSTEQILGNLVALYCRVGQPEVASDRLSSRPVDDPALYTGPGTPGYTHGLVNLLLGFYDLTINLWRDHAIPQVRLNQGHQGLLIARNFLFGQPLEATRAALELTGQPGASSGSVEIEAQWEFELGLCLLEAGDPEEAGIQFSKALALNPKILTRPLIEDYLKKLGVPPPRPSEPASPDPKPTAEAAPSESPR